MSQENNRTGSENISFLQIALALADDYESIYVVDMNDNSYVEYSTSGKAKEMTVRSSGSDFFYDLIGNAKKLVYKEDQDKFISFFEKEKIAAALDEGGSSMLDYRLVLDGKPKYYALKAIRRGTHSMVIGVQNVDTQRRRELAIREETRTYAEIAQSFAMLYEVVEVIFHVDLKTGHYKKYRSSDGDSKLSIDKGGDDFFNKLHQNVIRYIHKDDCYRVQLALRRDNLIKALDENSTVSIVYRRVLDGKEQYLNLIAMKSRTDNDRIVIGVGNIDTQVRKEKAIQAENRTFGEIAMALAQRYEVIYHVNIETDEYSEYSANEKYAKLSIGAKGDDFFGDTQKNMKHDIYPEDYPMMALAMRKENLLERLRVTGKTILNYRLILDDRPQFVTLFAVRPKEDSTHIIVAVANVDAAKRDNDLDISDAIVSANDMANRDGLTGVKNKRAYEQAEIEIDEKIVSGDAESFAIAICDINGLKMINDTKGHQAGDEYIRNACTLICNTFKHSPVFRIGGDEFAVLLKGADYNDRAGLIKGLINEQTDRTKSGQVTVAVGLSDFMADSDISLKQVFERADEAMYENKKEFKLQSR
ncbi:MAG: GGDEF domain-containing protein [Ruminococcus sp.]|nr:GGDEF domain-containing protein [Ruminococcus sp.]